jgi:hypothetical protein
MSDKNSLSWFSSCADSSILAALIVALIRDVLLPAIDADIKELTGRE